MKAQAFGFFILLAAAGMSCSPPTGPGSQIGPPPEQFTLEQNYPNPFHDSTCIVYGVPTGGAGSEVDVVAYDAYYSQVRVLIHLPNGSEGTFKTWWDGRDADFRIVPGGIYIIELRGYSPMTTIKRITVIKR